MSLSLESHVKCRITVGFSDVDFPLNKHPGFTKRSYCYRADGKAYHAKLQATFPLPKFEKDSIIGCGINFLQNQIFFTFDGKYFGPVFTNVNETDLYPTCGIDNMNEVVSFNFGGKKPFKFNYHKFLDEVKQEVVREILKLEVHPFDSHRIVYSYLLHSGYKDTLEAYEKGSLIEPKNAFLPPQDLARQHASQGRSHVNGNGVATAKDNWEMSKSLGQFDFGRSSKISEESLNFKPVC